VKNEKFPKFCTESLSLNQAIVCFVYIPKYTQKDSVGNRSEYLNLYLFNPLTYKLIISTIPEHLDCSV
jgi:hypothetical protein